jgi:hypothetical protein
LKQKNFLKKRNKKKKKKSILGKKKKQKKACKKKTKAKKKNPATVNISRVLELYNFAVTWLLKKKRVKKRVNWQWFYVLADLTYLFVFLFLSWFAVSLSREKS